MSVTLFQFQSESVKVSIEAYYEENNLIIDGYDIGRSVEEFWHREDYEYKLTIPPESIQFLMDHFQVSDHQLLLDKLASTFNTNTCYSDIRNLLDSNNQPCQGFTW
jgi:hypothetical protein